MARITFEHLRDKIVDIGIKKCLEWIFGLISLCGLGGILQKVVTLSFPALNEFRWYILAVFCGGIVVLYIKITRRYSRYRPNLPKVSSDYEIVSKDLSLAYTSATTVTQTTRVEIKSRHDGCSAYHGAYGWSGGGSVKVSCKTQGCLLVFPEAHRVGFQDFVIVFRPLQKGECFAFEIVIEAQDALGQAMPVLACSVSRPTQKMTLSVKFPQGNAPLVATCEVGLTVGTERIGTPQTMRFDAAGEMKWEIEDPQLLHVYRITWNKR